MSSRQNVLASMLAWVDVPFTTTNAASHPASSTAIAGRNARDGDRAGERAPTGRRRALQKYSRSWAIWLRQWSRSISTYRSQSASRHHRSTSIAATCASASRVSSIPRSGSSPWVRTLKIPSAATPTRAGRTKQPSSRQRRATRSASAAPTASSPFGGFISTARASTEPASAASVQERPSIARTVSAAITRPATIDG